MTGNFRKRMSSFLTRQAIRFGGRKSPIRISIRAIRSNSNQLSVFFATLCVVDLFGVFPIIALPAAIISCGYYGIPLMLFVITIQVYTAVILGRCWLIAEKLDPTIVQRNRYPYAAVADLTYGYWMRVFVTVLLDLTVFGGGIPNLLVASQNLQLLGLRISDGGFHFSFCFWLILIGVFMCPIMWLGSPKNMKMLATVSVFTVSGATGLAWYCIVTDKTYSESVFEGFKWELPSIAKMLSAYGIIAFQFDVHPMLMTIEVDMQEKHKIGKAVCNGIIITCVLSAITTALAAYTYGTGITPNVLEILPRSTALYFAILLVTLQLILSSSVGSSALFQHIEDILRVPRKFSLKRIFIRSLLVALAVAIAELVPRFDIVMGLIGGSLTGPLIFILPPLFYTKITKMEARYDDEMERRRRFFDDSPSSGDEIAVSSRYGTFYTDDAIIIKSGCLALCHERLKGVCHLLHSDCVLSIGVIFFGLIATLASTYFNFSAIDKFEFRSPCISNISQSFAE